MGCKKLNRDTEDVFTALMDYHYARGDGDSGEFNWGRYQEADGGELVVVANWNKPEFNRLGRFLRRNYPAVRRTFYDEIEGCCDCGAFVNTSPTGWGWQPNYIYIPGEGAGCYKCAHSSRGGIIDAYKNDPAKAVWGWFAPVLVAEGWTCMERDTNGCVRYETGFHAGQNDDPKVEAETLRRELPAHDFLFVITDSGQFDTNWTVYIRKREEE